MEVTDTIEFHILPGNFTHPTRERSTHTKDDIKYNTTQVERKKKTWPSQQIADSITNGGGGEGGIW